MGQVWKQTFRKPILGYLLFSGIMLAAAPVYAAGMNCDVRQLSLSKDQQNALKVMRNQNRMLRNEVVRAKPSNMRAKRDLAQLLMQDRFNETAARQYVSQKYQYNAELDMQDLRMQHYFFKVLTPAQKEQWLDHCLE